MAYLQGTHTGPFGGPEGDTKGAFMQLMAGFLEGEKKRKEEQQMGLLAQIFKGGGQPGAPGASGQPGTPMDFIERLFSSGISDKKTMGLGIEALRSLPTEKTAAPRKVGDTRTFKRQGKEITQEWTGDNWENLGETAQWKPDTEKPRAAGDTRTFKNKGREITQEWTGTKWKNLGVTGQWKPDKDDDEMTEPKARAKLYEIDKYRQRLKTTGGMDDIIFAMISSENPKLAESLRGKEDMGEINTALDEYSSYLRGFVKRPANDPAGVRRNIK